MALGEFDFMSLFPIVLIIPPTRWERLKAWATGTQAQTMCIRRIW